MIIGKINGKVLIDDLVLREEPEVLTRWQDPTIEEKNKEIERLNNGIDEIIKDIEHSTLLLEEGQVELKDTPFGKRILERLKDLKEGK